MEDLPEQLKKLASNRYFIVVAVVFFAFMTALVFALISASQTQQSTDDLRQQIRKETISQETVQKPSSALDTILTRIGLKKSQQPQTTDTTIPTSQTTRDKTTTIANLVKKAPPLPTVDVAKYILKTQLPAAPPVLRIYTVKTDYSQDEVKRIARTMGMTNLDLDSHNGPVTQIYDLSSQSYLSFNTNDGTFLFMSQSGVPSTVVDPIASARAYLNRIGITNDCIRPYATYQRTSQFGSTFVEFHCDGALFGGPILSSVGVLNLPTSIKFSQVKPGVTLGNEPPDNDISASSDGANYRRLSDFNTIVVEIKDSDGSIMAASSNIPYSATEEIVPQDRLIPPSQIVSRLEASQTTLGLTSPLGEGFLDLSTVYAGGAAVAQSAEVHDAYVAYDMSPGLAGKYLCPSYFVRSYGKITTGYEAQFIETVPAVNDPRCTGEVLGTNIIAQFNPAPTLVPQKTNSSLQYGTFEYKPTIPEEQENSCPIDQFTNAYAVPGRPGVYIAWVDQNTVKDIEEKRFPIAKSVKRPGSYTGNLPQGTKLFPKGATARKWYVVTLSTGTELSAEQLKTTDQAKLINLRGQLVSKCKIGNRTSCPLPPGFNGQVVSCTYLTTGSPHIRLYPAHTMNMTVTVSPKTNLSYANPGYNNGLGSWTVRADTSGTLTLSGQHKQSLYWEFEKGPIVSLLEKQHAATEGYVVKKTDAAGLLTSTIAPALGLTDSETADFVAELKREAAKISSETVRLSFVSREFLDTNLSMQISPNPARVYRFVLYVEQARPSDTITAPTLTSIDRSGSIAVETGVIAND